MARNFFDVYGCTLCEREVATESGTNKEFVCCDLPMRLVKKGTEFEKIDSTEWHGDKLTANIGEEVGFTGDSFLGKNLISTPTIDVRLLSFRPGQETLYEKAAHDLTLFVVEGNGVLALGYEDLELAQSMVVVVPRGMLWGIKNNSSSMVVLQTINKK